MTLSTDAVRKLQGCVQVCHLYVEGSGGGDHLKQIVPHHELAAEQSRDHILNDVLSE